MNISDSPNHSVPKRMNYSSTDKNERYVSKMEKHIEKASEAMKYSSDRFDILIISLATGALVLSVGSSSGLLSKIPKLDTSFLKFAWLMMVCSILSNLISQISGYFANEKDIQVSNNLIRLKRGKQMTGNQDNLKRWCSTFNRATLVLNGLSMVLLIVGMIFLVTFYSKNI
jgi:hypothetical protein